MCPAFAFHGTVSCVALLYVLTIDRLCDERSVGLCAGVTCQPVCRLPQTRARRLPDLMEYFAGK